MSPLFSNRKRQRWGRALCVLAAAGFAALYMFTAGQRSDTPRSLALSRAPAIARAHARVLRASRTLGPAVAPRALDPRVSLLARVHPDRTAEVIVQFKSGVTAARARQDARRAGAGVAQQLGMIHALALRLPAVRALTLAGNPDVHAVSLNSPVTVEDTTPDPAALQTTFNQSLDVPALWRMGATGQRIGVAVIDTGVDGQLADFRSAAPGDSRVIATAVANPQAQTVLDSYGHGTDVAGIVAGNGANRDPSDPLRGQFVGVAPDANLISIKVSDEHGNATVLDVINGLDFAVDHQRRYNIRVVNLSLDSTTAQSYATDPLDAAVEAAWLHGIVVVVAAGNGGEASDAVQYAPANDPFVITVGGVDEHGTADTRAHTIADWSSRGTTQDGFAEPSVYAPGAHIVSVLAPSSAFASLCSTCIVDGQYIRASGTSMAAPMIAGLVADLLELHPRWTPDQVKGALADSAAWADAFPEVDAAKLAALDRPPRADQNLVTNTMVDGASGNVDYSKSSWSKSSWSKSSWSKSSWSVATGALSASFAKSSWSCDCGIATAANDPSSSFSSAASWGTDGLN